MRKSKYCSSGYIEGVIISDLLHTHFRENKQSVSNVTMEINTNLSLLFSGRRQSFHATMVQVAFFTEV